MIGVICKPNTQEKLNILSADAQYDLACACSAIIEEHCRRNQKHVVAVVKLRNREQEKQA